MADGKNLLHSTSQVRTWKNGEIIEEAETRDDAFIIDCIKGQVAESVDSEYVDAIRVIGEAYACLSSQSLIHGSITESAP
ncbi:DUF3658 domain-containing protein [Planococcus sp. SE5232]|uniref:DUF3658 domain-containing protein n=1 Tax=unclassified Planococcus (in: firmicutes) TaxID=2662419 RepID=UPI003D6B2744